MRAWGRAITLIELLIVLAVALALGAVSLRGAVTWSDADRLRAAEDGLASAALEARAEALRIGSVIELVTFESERGTVLVGSRREALVDQNETITTETISDEIVVRLLYELPEGMTITSEDSAELGASLEIVLMRLLPDGSAVLGSEPWRLVRGEERYSAAVERWTARLTLSPIETVESESIAEVAFAGDGGVP